MQGAEKYAIADGIDPSHSRAVWGYAGLRDLYCAFVLSEDDAFEYPERFLEISALESAEVRTAVS